MEQSRSPMMDHVAMVVGHDLKLDVVRILDELLNIDAGIAERLLRLRARGVDSPGPG